MTMIRVKTAVALASLAFAHTAIRAQQLAVSNSLNVDRTDEVIDLPYAEAASRAHAAGTEEIVATDTQSAIRLPSQRYTDLGRSEPDRLLVMVHLHAHQTIHIRLTAAAHPPPIEPLVFGREATERKDDFAWENKLVTYRVYGPALQATGEIASGIDVWSKRVPGFVIDSFYQRDAEGARTHNPAFSYHQDNGQGLDSYEVGRTRGCGGTAVFANNQLSASKNYNSFKLLSPGPIRFAFELTYAPWNANGVGVTETKRITLDAGSRLNQIDSTWTFAEGRTIEVAAGLADHAGGVAGQLANGDALSVWDTPQLPTAGRIATGMVSTQKHRSAITLGHALMLFPVHSGEAIHYAAGSGWSKADMPTQADWDAYLKLYLLQQQHPLLTTWGGQ